VAASQQQAQNLSTLSLNEKYKFLHKGKLPDFKIPDRAGGILFDMRNFSKEAKPQNFSGPHR